jgi:cysteine desulfurase
MLPYFSEMFGNAASRSHSAGWKAGSALEAARVQVCSLIGARPTEIVFTSGATEAINLALLGLGSPEPGSRDHVITQKTEHPAVLETIEVLSNRGFRVTQLGVDSVGRIDLDELSASLSERTLVVAIMLANNEIGTVQPITEIGALCRKVGALFFCDLTQGVGWHPIDVNAAKIDMASISSHKIYGPKGVGALFARRFKPTVRLEPIIFGGGHEQGLRPGTPNVSGIVGLGAACEMMQECGDEIRQRTSQLRDRLQETIFSKVDARLNGCPDDRHPGNLNFFVPGVSAEILIGALPDLAFSAGSACTSASAKPSHVIRALNGENEALKNSIRFGVSKQNTESDIDYAAERFLATVQKLQTR